MKFFRAVVAGVVLTVFSAVVGAATCGGLFNWVYQLEPTHVWKPMQGHGPGAEVYVGMLVLNLVFVAVYLLLYKGIPGRNVYVKGLVFGLCVWAVGMLPGMFATYSFMTVAPTVIIYWTVMDLIQSPLSGLIAAAICGKQE